MIQVEDRMAVFAGLDAFDELGTKFEAIKGSGSQTFGEEGSVTISRAGRYRKSVRLVQASEGVTILLTDDGTDVKMRVAPASLAKEPELIVEIIDELLADLKRVQRVALGKHYPAVTVSDRSNERVA